MNNYKRSNKIKNNTKNFRINFKSKTFFYQKFSAMPFNYIRTHKRNSNYSFFAYNV